MVWSPRDIPTESEELIKSNYVKIIRQTRGIFSFPCGSLESKGPFSSAVAHHIYSPTPYTGSSPRSTLTTSFATRLMAMLRADDVVLVKGSRGVRTDLVVARLEAEWA